MRLLALVLLMLPVLNAFGQLSVSVNGPSNVSPGGGHSFSTVWTGGTPPSGTHSWSTYMGTIVSQGPGYCFIQWNYTGSDVVHYSYQTWDNYYSYYHNVSITGAPLNPPTATSATSVTSTSFVANWNTVSGAAGYRLDVSTSSSFSSFVPGYNSLSVTTNSKSVSNLDPGKTYYYRVRTVMGSTQSPSSNTITVHTVPIAPTTYFASSVGSNSFIVIWEPSAGAISYRLDVSLYSSFSSFVSGYNNLSVSGTTQSVTGLAANTTYYYRIRAVNDGGTSVNSNTITVVTAPVAPVASTATGITETSFTANWGMVGTASYKLDVSENSEFSTFVSGFNNISVSGTNKSVTGLSAGKVYYYRVRAVSGGASGNSNSVTALTLPAAPEITAPTSITTTSFVANWITSVGSTSYRLDISTQNDFSTYISGFDDLLVTTTSKSVTNLTPGTTYYYRLRSVNASGTSGNSGTTNIITIPSTPGTPVASNRKTNEFTVSWSSVVGATSYQLDVSTQNNYSDYVDQYQSMIISGTTSNITGLSPSSIYYCRIRAVNSSGISNSSNTLNVTTQALNYDQNYVRTVVVKKSGLTNETMLEEAPLDEKQVFFEFFDGLGRPVQNVSVQQSPDQHDIVEPFAYDGFGRQAVKYLPYVSGNTGAYKTNFLPKDHNDYATVSNAQYQFYQGIDNVAIDEEPYAETVYEASPINRPDKDFGTGAAWHSNNKFIQHGYLANQHSTDSSAILEKIIAWDISSNGMPVRRTVLLNYILTGGYYADGQLTINSTKDEHGIEVREYTNKNGQTILKKVQAETTAGRNLNSVTGWALTYYLYDDYGNLRFVFSPELSKLIHANADNYSITSTDLANWAYQYNYDGRNRIATKQMPGAGVTYMVYDKRDRLVLTQDPNQRSTAIKYWSFTKYDELNRPILTGVKDTVASLNQAEMQEVVNMHYNKSWAKLYETYVGATVGNTHGYSNKSYPICTGPNMIIDDNRYLSVTYYDTYVFKKITIDSSAYGFLSNHLTGQEESNFKHVMGQVTGTKIKVLDGGLTGGSTWLKTVNYYDHEYRLIQSVADNYKQGHDRITNIYDFSGKVLKTISSHNEHDVNWKDLTTGVSRSGERLYRSMGGNSDDQGAASASILPASTDGWFEFTHSNGNTLFIGFSDANINTSYTTIDYCLRVGGSSSYATYVSGGNQVVLGTHVIGDVFRIERISDTVRILKNGTVVHTFSGTSTSPLLVDVSFNGGQASILNARASFASSAHSILRSFKYDHADRILSVWHKLDNEDSVLLIQNVYNQLGQIIDKKLHSTDGQNFEQSIDRAYNIRGWLTKINESDLSIDDDDANRDLFGMHLLYNTVDVGIANTGLYNGNISAIAWSNNQALGEIKQNAYTYSYDPLSRIKASHYRESNEDETGIVWTLAFNHGNVETGLTYDMNGNIKTLQRNDRRANGWMDNLSYEYGTTRSNKLLKVKDNGDKTKGFIDINSTSEDYAYDANGNMIIDRNKGGKELLTNPSFENGTSGWALTNNTRLIFTNGEVQVTSGTDVSTLKQAVVSSNRLYTFMIEIERNAGTVTISLGGVTTNFNTSGVHVISMNSGGANSDFMITLSTNFSGKIKSASLNAVTTITYNLLNLPETVTRAGDKQLQYIYDATGRKLKEEILKNNALEKVTDYSGEFIYENDTLQFINHDEGRIVTGLVSGLPTWEYQYHLKDHLGNVRITFTAKHEVDTTIATLETENVTEEESQFLYYDEAVKINSAIFDHTNSGATHYALRLTGTANHQFGLAKSLSVMPGDTIRATVYAKYLESDTTQWNQGGFASFMNTIRWGTPAGGVLIDGGFTGTTGGVIPPVVSLANKGEGSEEGAPKAYLNFLVFNMQDSLIDGGYVEITEAAREYGQDGPHEQLFKELAITEAGYVYLYLSNDNFELGGNVIEVFFDDFMVEHVKSPVVQQDDYYPFGLNFNSCKREDKFENNFLFNGKERLNGLDLGWMDYGARMYMPEIGRWNAVDPKLEKYTNNSPYNYVLNNPLSFIDPTGMEVEALPGGYRYTGSDAQAIFRFIKEIGQQRRDNHKRAFKKNAYVALIKDKQLREATNERASTDGYGHWAVFAARDLNEAANLAAVLPDKSLDNLVLETHGGSSESRNGLLVDSKYEGVSPVTDEMMLTSTELAGDAACTLDPDAANLLKIMDKVRDGGNVIFAACFLAKGPQGDNMLNGLFNLSGRRVTILGSMDYAIKDRFYLDLPNLGIHLDGSLTSKKATTKHWRGISHITGDLFDVKDIKTSENGSKSILFEKFKK